MQQVEEHFYAQIEVLANIMFRCFGLFPVVISKQQVICNSKFSETVLKCWSFCVIFFATINVSAIIKYQEEVFNENSLGKVNDILKFSFVLVAVYVIIFESLANCENYRNIYRQLEGFNVVCKSLQVNFERYENEKAKNIGRYFVTFLLMQIIIETSIFFNRE